ncbi:DUF1871 family protein [Mesobacillus selenatarsenatis]|uniref:DUF1871 domain-containing protein n=1 Tax=Mesobacillus selenatarsenatis (strain DSM 18680 / JCM 14380 / FERM P-15431 / SF-1) TaxID=1321606 RepID=A0A0A8WXI0_MESS1|nr:DUF1871 family protein [Mesobacillus selenatarsenatis]GAM12370.1 hypothetical protein SAMD00020551_0503 [Mesobacillus selenatarsenatis SF-1]
MNEFSIVKEVIDAWDPFNLLAIHCPDDEYDEEIKDIVEILPKVNSAGELAIEINKIMYKAFEEDFKKSMDCLKIGERMLILFN